MPLAGPPPPYQAVEDRYTPLPSRPAPWYHQQQQYKSEPLLSSTQPSTGILRKKRSAWNSALNVSGGQRTDLLAVPPAQGWQSTTSLPAQIPSNDVSRPSTGAPPLQQGSQWCDDVATTLNDALSQLDGETGQHDTVIDTIMQGLTINVGETPSRERRNRSKSAELPRQSKSGLINFNKTWLYANSRLPPQMLPFKVYIPTWQVLCQAADASLRVYHKPAKDEKEEYIAANRDERTKAMVLKSVTMDEKNLIVFAIRGSKWNRIDWAVNLAYEPEHTAGFLDDDGNACHAGFLRVARAMVRPVAARLRQLLEQNPSRTTSSLVITGHSAGGAVASLLYMHMMSTRVESELNILTDCFRRVHCVTFGAPPVALLPLQKPNRSRCVKSIFTSFINEGDPVARIADKEYVLSLARLVAAAPPPALDTGSKPTKPHGLKHMMSRQQLKPDSQPLRQAIAASMWPIPEVPLSNAGRLVLLRTKPGQRLATEAVSVTDDQLRDVVFGDPAMHSMALYERRIDELACAAVTGRSGG